MNTIDLYVFNERENRADVRLLEDGKVQSLTDVTRARIELYNADDPTLAGLVCDSSLTPTCFDWVARGAEGVLVLRLGAMGFPPAWYRARLVLYDAGSPGGLVWTHEVTPGCDGTRVRVCVLDAAAVQQAA